MPRKHVNIGGSFFGVSTRVDGRTRANFIVSPATGRDRKVVGAVKSAVKVPRTGRRAR